MTTILSDIQSQQRGQTLHRRGAVNLSSWGGPQHWLRFLRRRGVVTYRRGSSPAVADCDASNFAALGEIIVYNHSVTDELDEG